MAYPDLAAGTRATGETLLERLIDVPVKLIVGVDAETEYFDITDMRIAAGLGMVGGAAIQGFRANKRIEQAAQTGNAQKFKYALL